MNHKRVFQGIRASFTQLQIRQRRLALALALFGGLLVDVTPGLARAEVGAAHCNTYYDAEASYPALPETAGAADVSGEAGVIMYLQHERAVVELEGCFYLADRPLVVDFSGLDFVTLIVELPDSTASDAVHVYEDGVWTQTHTVSSGDFRYTMAPTHEVGFELASPDGAAPTGPVIVAKPTTGNPEPK